MNYLKTFLPYLFGNKKGKSLDSLLPDAIPWSSLCFEEVLMFHVLKNSINQYVYSIDLETLSKKDIFHLFNYLNYLNCELNNKITSFFLDDLVLYYQSIKANSLRVKELQELLDFKNQKLTVFALLKVDRTKPGIMIVRAPSGHFVTNKRQNIWSIPILGLSGRGLPFNHSNGCTPTGVFSLDSVMPKADNNSVFGEFRRLIVNFINKSPDEIEIKKLLPQSHHQLNWWKPSVVGRELGRGLLRIHGTGQRNLNPFCSYYPFFPTSGCLATNESSLFGFNKAQDQRLLLDTLMSALNMPATLENESKIHGLLYVVELDDNLAALRFLV